MCIKTFNDDHEDWLICSLQNMPELTLAPPPAWSKAIITLDASALTLPSASPTTTRCSMMELEERRLSMGEGPDPFVNPLSCNERETCRGKTALSSSTKRSHIQEQKDRLHAKRDATKPPYNLKMTPLLGPRLTLHVINHQIHLIQQVLDECVCCNLNMSEAMAQ